MLPDVLNELERVLTELGLSGDEFTVRMTGCPNGCVRPYNADIGLVGKARGKYTIYLGGNILGTRLGQIYADHVALEEIVKTLVPLLSYFQQARNVDERFGDFCHRVGLAELHARADRNTACDVE